MRLLEPIRISGRDEGIKELIEYFDAPERYGRWDLLTDREIAIIELEAQKCNAHFSYAARNYFMMVDKRRVERIFEFWESQFLILDRLQQLQDQGRPGKILVVKARQLGASLLLEMLIAWKSMFFRNTNAAVVSYDPDHSAYLFSLMQYVYDRMPWWLKPMCSSREFKNGLVFENPDYEDRRRNPGLNSRISVQSANKMSGVGQGMKINAFHGSEIGDWANAAEVIDGDLVNALVEDVDTIAALESTAKGSGTYFHRLWLRNVELGDSAEWHPIFLPWFFEKTRVLAPPKGWRPNTEEIQMQQQVEMEWLRCTNPACLQYHERIFRQRDRTGGQCPTCSAGFLAAYQLTPGQMFWREVKRKNADRDEISAKLLKQEMACVVGDTLVSTDQGIIPIAAAQMASRTETGQITQWWDHGLQPVWTVKTKRGRELVCTEIHKFYVENDWVQCKDIKVGDRIRLRRPTFGSAEVCVEIAINAIAKKHVKITKEFALFLGYYMGDGCINSKGIRFAVDAKDDDVALEIVRLSRELFGVEPKVKQRKGMLLVSVNSGDVSALFEELGLTKRTSSKTGYSRYVHVPDFIMRSPRHIVAAFISALFECDGHAYRDTPKSVLFTCHPRFAAQVQLLLLGFAINSTVRVEDKVAGDGHKYTGRSVVMTAEASNLFNREIGWRSKRKSESACIRSTNHPRAIRNDAYDEIASVEYAGEQRVYDLTIAEHHCFGTNGILSHNTTSTDAFQSGGYTLFPESCQNFVQKTVREPRYRGHFDIKDRFHALDPYTLRCIIPQCGIDHIADPREVWVWELPDPSSDYVIGADVAEGLGGPDADYSVAVVLKIGKNGAPDREVAKYRSNRVNPIDFAYMLKSLGKFYNTAMISVELNKYDTAASTLRFTLQYPNLYRWKSLDSVNILTNKYGWVTNQVTKPRLYQTFIRYLKAEMVIVRSKNCSEEMKTFQKEEMGSRSAEAALGAYDDELMATMIALYCAHEAEYDDNLGYTPFQKRVTLENAPWIMKCGSCSEQWGQETPTERMNCPRCNSIMISGNKNVELSVVTMKENVTDELFDPPEMSDVKDYSLL